MPSVAIPTRPGDVLAFDANLLHPSAGARRRLAWNVHYFGAPTGRTGHDVLRDLIAYSS